MELTELCQELRNWFERDKYFGTFTIENGAIIVPDGSLQDGQFFRVIGSVFNDGVHRYGEDADELTDEVFKGAIWSMAVPPAVIELSERITAWSEQYGESVSSPYSSMSESFGDYSRSWSKASSGSGNANSASSPSWRSTFADELNRWRKI